MSKLGLITTGAAVAALGAAPAASAEPRTITVTLFGGATAQIVVDVPPGTPLDEMKLPPLVTGIVDVTVSDPAPVPTQPPASAPEPTPQSHDATSAPTAPKSKTKKADKQALAGVEGVSPARTRRKAARTARPQSAPSLAPPAAEPTFSYALPGPALIGVPNFFIDKFRIPPFLLPIYQAAGVQYGVRWEILAAINEIETDYGRNLSVSTAGAEGWMQFMPATWKTFGTDANGDGEKDPYNPVDAIFAAARYLKHEGAATDIKKAIFAYNHADWYVDSVLMRARLIGGAPADLIGSLTGLTEGRFPVAATSTYAKGSSEGLNIYARAGAAAIAVQDAKVTKLGYRRKLGRFIQIRDIYGNTYTYGNLAKVASTYELSTPARPSRSAAGVGREAADSTSAASMTDTAVTRLSLNRRVTASVTSKLPVKGFDPATGGRLIEGVPPTMTQDVSVARGTLHPRAAAVRAKRIRVGTRLPAGTVLGRIGSAGAGDPHLRFEIRPVGKDAPRIDPKPILDGWKLLEATAIYRFAGKNPLTTKDPSIGQVLLMSKEQLMHRVLEDQRISIYKGGREDIKAGRIDRRVLATLEFLAASGLKPTVSCLMTGHSLRTTSGNISEHSSGNAVDISAINGIAIAGHQGAGSITDIANRALLTLQGTVKPHQIISLMTYQGADNTLALPDHADHVHVGFRPEVSTVLKPLQWTRLVDRLAEIDNPVLETNDR